MDAAVEVRDRLRLVVVEHLEVVLREVGDEALLRVLDGDEDRDDLRARFERRLLLRAESRGRERQRHRRSEKCGCLHGLSLSQCLCLAHADGERAFDERFERDRHQSVSLWRRVQVVG